MDILEKNKQIKKLCIVSSVYNLIKTREFECYVLPTLDLAKDLINSDIDLVIFTDQDETIFPKGNNIHVIKTEPDEFMKQFWDNKDWKKIYSDGVSDVGFRKQKAIPELASIWLGKFQMIKIASFLTKADFFLWQDAGICFYYEVKKTIEKYKRKKAYASSYNRFAGELLDNNCVAFMTYKKNYHKNFHGVNMLKYLIDHREINQKKLIKAGLFLCKSSAINCLFDQIKKNWLLLIKNKDYGTEENSMTLYSWENNIATFTYEQFLHYMNHRFVKFL